VNELRDFADGKKSYLDDTPAVTGDALTVWKIQRAGVKSKVIYQPMLRHTRTVSSSYQVPASLTGVGTVYSTARLLALEPIPSLISGSLQSSSTTTRTDGVKVAFGWLKTYPTISIASHNKAQIVQEWQWGQWADKLYTFDPTI
jgi:hypothetical protein